GRGTWDGSPFTEPRGCSGADVLDNNPVVGVEALAAGDRDPLVIVPAHARTRAGVCVSVRGCRLHIARGRFVPLPAVHRHHRIARSPDGRRSLYPARLSSTARFGPRVRER